MTTSMLKSFVYTDDPVVVNPAEYGFTASICKLFKKSELAVMLNRYLK